MGDAVGYRRVVAGIDAWRPLTQAKVPASGTGNCLAAGLFTKAGGQSAFNIARWDGASWHALGTGTDGIVQSLRVFGDDLIVGGLFTFVGGVAAPAVARWDGSAWHAMDTGMSDGEFFPQVRTLAPSLDSEGLIGAGHFYDASGRPTKHIAHWDAAPEAWLPASGGLAEGGLDDGVHSFLSTDDGLYLACAFETAGSDIVNNIALRTGRGYEPLRGGVLGTVHSLMAFEGNVIAGRHRHRHGRS